MSQVLAVLASVLYGIGDFAGGLGARKMTPWSVTVWSLLLALPLVFVGLFIVGWDEVTTADIGYGAVAGVFGFIGIVALYGALAAGTMSIVSPMTGALIALIPVVWGLVAGETISGRQWIGIVVAIIAITLVAWDRTHAKLTPAVMLTGLVAAVALSGFFIALDHTAEASGQWPLVVENAVALGLGFVVLVFRKELSPPPREALPVIAVAGNGTVAASMSALLALQTGPLGITVVLTSIYPAFTVIAAVIVLHERPTVMQRGGIVLALVAAALLVA
ncbi:DMT family transporter [bacterium]|nr:DMT family transporter [bacterium]